MSTKSTYPWFYFFRIARLSLIVFLPTLFLILISYRSTHKEGLITQVNGQIEENLRTLRHTFEKTKTSPNEWCQHLPLLHNARYSLVDNNGLIICDSLRERVGKKINDATEVNNAFKEEYASSVRFSDFFKTEAVFGSLKINDKLVIRKVIPITELKTGMNQIDQILFLRILPFAIISYLIFLYL